MGLNPNIWLPHLKFTLQTIAITYPSHPNDVSKRKYYDLVQNLPVFFPFSPIGKNFLDLLDKYPVTPYLSSRMSFMKWVHYIECKIKTEMEDEVLGMMAETSRKEGFISSVLKLRLIFIAMISIAVIMRTKDRLPRSVGVAAQRFVCYFYWSDIEVFLRSFLECMLVLLNLHAFTRKHC